jgi:hypothetical protein
LAALCTVVHAASVEHRQHKGIDMGDELLNHFRAACHREVGFFWPVMARLIAMGCVATILVALVYLRTKLRINDEQSYAKRQGLTLSAGDWLGVAGPLLCGLLVFLVFLAALTMSGFYGSDLDGRAFLFLKEFQDRDADMVAEQSARGLWGVAIGMLVMAEAFVLWNLSEIWLHCDERARRNVAWVAGAVFVVIVAVIVGRAVLVESSTAFGSTLVLDLVCLTSARSDLYRIGPFTDGLNMLGILIPLAVAAAFGLTILSSSSLGKKFAENLVVLGRCQRMLDRLLLASAAVLVAGLVEVVTLVSWSYASYPGSTELKQHMDICKASGTVGMELDKTEFCRSAIKIAKHAQHIDDARRFTRSLALTYGFCFSGVLVALYAPAALHLKKQVRAVLHHAPYMEPEDLAEALSRANVDRTPYRQALTVAVSLTPVLAGVISAVLSQ